MIYLIFFVKIVLQSTFVLLIQRKNSMFLITYRLMMVSNKSAEEILSCAKKILSFVLKLGENDYENIFGFN